MRAMKKSPKSPIDAGPLDRLLTVEDVCELTQLSPATLYRFRRDGSGPAWLRIGNSIRYRRSQVMAFLSGNQPATMACTTWTGDDDV